MITIIWSYVDIEIIVQGLVPESKKIATAWGETYPALARRLSGEIATTSLHHHPFLPLRLFPSPFSVFLLGAKIGIHNLQARCSQ